MHAVQRSMHTCYIKLVACCIPAALHLTALKKLRDVAMMGMGSG